MYDAHFWSKIITAALNYLPWPIIVLIIILIFKDTIRSLINDSPDIVMKIFGAEFRFKRYDRKKDKVVIEDKSGKESVETNMKEEKEKTESRLTEKEIDASKRKAQSRLDEDIKRVGYQRGELYQLSDGSWGVTWKITVKDSINIKDSL